MLDLMKIAKNDSYELAVNKSQNCLILTILGLWDNTSQLENYCNDIKSAVEELSQGFNVIIDLRQYRGSTSEYVSLHVEAQKLVISSGLNKTAVILSNNPMLKVTVDYIFKQTGINPTYFNNMSAAEQWLSLYLKDDGKI